MKIAGYIRVSTDEQAEKGNSLFEQQDRLISYCKAMGWPEPTFYEDDGYSAKDLRRPALTRLLDDVKTKGYTLLLTTKLDRLSRRLFDILSVIEYLGKYNCNYASASEPFDTNSPAGRMTLQMLGMIAEFERERISERVRDNMKSIAKRGDKVISRPCLGYDIKDGAYVINVAEALDVQKMGEWLAQGMGSRDVAKRANAMGIRTKSGKMWTDKTVRDLFRRHTLVGDFVYNRTYRKGTRVFIRPKEEWIIIRDHHPAILDRETFDAIQRQLDSRKSVGRSIDSSTYLLSGLLKCTHCGHTMTGRADKKYKNKGKYYRYVCGGYMKKGICFFHWIDRDELERIILDRIKEIASSHDLPKLNVHRTRKTQSEKEVILARLHKLDVKMQRQIEAYEEELISAHDLKKARERVEKERKQLQQELTVAEKKENTQDEQKIHDTAKQLLDDVLSDDRVKAKHAIRQLIHKIEITDGEKVNIVWNMP